MANDILPLRGPSPDSIIGELGWSNHIDLFDVLPHAFSLNRKRILSPNHIT